MHEGCNGSFESGQQMLAKVRMMGYGYAPLPVPFDVTCSACGQTFVMERFETTCPCGMVHAVTPCSAHDPANVMPAGKEV